MKTYISEVLDVTEHNLRTLATTFDVLSFSQTKTRSELLIKWIFSKNNSEDYYYFSKKVTAKILVGLIVNKWPTSLKTPDVDDIEIEEPFKEITDIYLKIAFEASLIPNDIEKTLTEKYITRKVTLQHDLCIFLENSIKTLIQSVEKCCTSLKKLIHFSNIAVLIKNILNYLLEFQLLEEEDVDQNSLSELMKIVLQKINDALNFCFTDKNFDDVMISVLTESMICLNTFFANSTSPGFDEKIREIISTELLKSLFSFLLEHNRGKCLFFIHFSFAYRIFISFQRKRWISKN